jgi:hypothetical protein
MSVNPLAEPQETATYQSLAVTVSMIEPRFDKDNK